MTDRADFFAVVRRLVRCIPPGKVATYGQIARLAGAPRGARMVGWAMHSITEADDVPWHRVINARGEISLGEGAGAEFQRALLEDEGIEFGIHGRIDLKQYGWEGLEGPELQQIIRGEVDST